MLKLAIRYLWGVQFSMKAVTFSLKGAEIMDSKKIGAFIAANRKKKGLTQEQLGEKLGVSNKTISRWENGNYMPDLSLLEPLSKELGISLNELLAGEEIVKEKVIEYSEQNLVSTIDYSNKQIEKVRSQISYIVMIIGILVAICSIIMFNPESSWGSFYSIIGMIIFVIGLFKTIKIKNIYKKIGICVLTFIAIFSLWYTVDMISVCEFKRPPMYRYKTTTDFGTSKIITYDSVFYSVYRINADTKNEYYIIDIGKKETEDSIPITPFNRDKSGIDNIIKYKNKYIGNNSNIGNLISDLPLAEYGYVFEIDSEKCGLTIDYNTTDWYNNENMYIEQALVYISVSAFALIENLEYITFNFSGSSYSVTRQAIEENYPNYSDILNDSTVDTEKFQQYVEQKMNDRVFVSNIIKLFDTD